MSALQLAKAKAPYERVVVTRDEALGMFQENKFKVLPSQSLPRSFHPFSMHDRCLRSTRPNSAEMAPAEGRAWLNHISC